MPKEDHFPISLRGYIHTSNQQKFKSNSRALDRPSDWVVVFDTETTTDAAQQLRFGTYQVRKVNDLKEEGIFYDLRSLTCEELKILRTFAEANHLALRTRENFIEEIFYGIAYDLGAAIVGFNLPFDISRLAESHGTAKSKAMRGGFTFKLSPDPTKPHVQVKSLSQRAAFIRFAAPASQKASRGMRRREMAIPPSRGFFCDVKTLAAALTGQSWGLGSLSRALNVPHPKLDTEEHGGKLTSAYIAYAIRDTLTTWECFMELRDRYMRHGLVQTPYHHIFSEASLGKAYLKEMGVKPWRELQPDFPPALIGSIMSSYYGGRSEVHIRRTVEQVIYCDFLSMYPTVCALMGLWRYATSKRLTWQDTTKDTQVFLQYVALNDLQSPELWKRFCTLVQVKPDADIFPIRSEYGDTHLNIGANHLTSKTPLWFTLADCIAAKLLTGKAPKVIQAITFAAVGIQENLNPIAIAGNPDHMVDPSKDDFYKNLIDRRNGVKEKLKRCKPSEKQQFEIEQMALKILTNAIGYGVFVELNVEELNKQKIVTCIRQNGKGFSVPVNKIERAGNYFHPLLGTLITGAARLMLAIAERLTLDSGLNWAFCDTDSIAIVKPKNISQEKFKQQVYAIRNWFNSLNPYAIKTPLLKIEHGETTPVYCLALSAKRYALFELSRKGEPKIIKASAHGLGYLIAPYQKSQCAEETLKEIGIEPWQHDLWHRIISETLKGNHTHYNPADLKGFNHPAVSRYGATTPHLLKWCKHYNADKPYREQIRPFGFLYALHPLNKTDPIRVIAPYDKNIRKAVGKCFDRDTGTSVGTKELKTYFLLLAQYHLQPETKFLNSDARDRGQTERRHIIAERINYIGKEAHRWEEQMYLGFNPEAQIEYGAGPEGRQKLFNEIGKAAKTYGKQKLAYTANISAKHLSAVLQKSSQASPEVMNRLYHAIEMLEREKEEKARHTKALLKMAQEQIDQIGLSAFAKKIDISPANLSNTIVGRRSLSLSMTKKLEELL